jgi:hypothetical protein
MDYGNALMYGVNASIVSKLQRVQNTAARLVTRKKKYEHITPTLKTGFGNCRGMLLHTEGLVEKKLLDFEHRTIH